MIKTRFCPEYFCDICGEVYPTRDEANEVCGNLPLEEPRFSVGDSVTFWDGKGAYYEVIITPCGITLPVVMTITGISGPVLGFFVDDSGNRTDFFGHVYQYEVAYSCPVHDKECSARFFANELQHTRDVPRDDQGCCRVMVTFR